MFYKAHDVHRTEISQVLRAGHKPRPLQDVSSYQIGYELFYVCTCMLTWRHISYSNTRTDVICAIVHFPYCIINIVPYYFSVFQFSFNTVMFKIYSLYRHILNKPRKSQCHMLYCLFAIFLSGCCHPFSAFYCTSFNKQRKQDVFWGLIIAKSLVEVELKWVSKIKVKQYDKRDRMIKRMWGCESLDQNWTFIEQKSTALKSSCSQNA